MGEEYSSRVCDGSVQKAGVHQLLEEELDITQLGVLYAQRFQHAQVAVFHRHENGAQVFQV